MKRATLALIALAALLLFVGITADVGPPALADDFAVMEANAILHDATTWATPTTIVVTPTGGAYLYAVDTHQYLDTRHAIDDGKPLGKEVATRFASTRPDTVVDPYLNWMITSVFLAGANPDGGNSPPRTADVPITETAPTPEVVYLGNERPVVVIGYIG